MKRSAIGFVAFVLACALANAQAPTPAPNTNAQATELATRLGRERSAEGLETILRAKNVDLLAAYDRGFRETAMRLYTEQGNKSAPVPADVEAVMVRYYADPVMGGRIPGLCGTNGAACQTRALFDLMLAELRSGKFRGSDQDLREATIRSQASGVEATLTAWLDAADAPTSYTFNSVVQVLGRRKYAPAVPVLAARLAKGDPAQASPIEYALIEIATPAAIDALLARLAALKASPAPTAAQQSKSLADRMAQIGPEVPIPYERLSAALPADSRQYAITWLTKRKDLEAVPDALALLGDRAMFSNAVNALIASDSPEVWKQARAEVERLKKEGKLEDYLYRSASATLDGKIGDPAKHMAEKARVDRQREFENRRGLLAKGRGAAMNLRESDPDAYARGMRDHLLAAEKLVAEYADVSITAGARQEIGSDYMEMAHRLRFRLRRPKEALEPYAAAQRNGQPLGMFAVADTYQFDLLDRERALAEYRKLPALPRTNPYGAGEAEAMLDEWGRRWLAAQEAYLAKGQKFSGPIGEKDIGVASMLIMYGGAGGAVDTPGLGPLREALALAQRGGQVDRAEVKRVLDKTPASAFVLMQNLPFVSYLPDAAAILAFLERHDPAGFATACYFGLIELVERRGAKEVGYIAPGMGPAAGKDPLREAKARFVRERRIDLGEVAKPPDKRMSSPQATWELFIASLRKADLETAMACLTPRMQTRFKPLFSGMNPAQLRESADSFKGFQLSAAYGEFQEALVVRSNGKAGSVTFVNAGGAWKIEEM